MWGIDGKGTRIPLDPSAPVYELGRFDPNAGAFAVERDGGTDTEDRPRPLHYVNHHATCTKLPKEKQAKPRSVPDHRATAAGE